MIICSVFAGLCDAEHDAAAGVHQVADAKVSSRRKAQSNPKKATRGTIIRYKDSWNKYKPIPSARFHQLVTAFSVVFIYSGEAILLST